MTLAAVPLDVAGHQDDSPPPAAEPQRPAFLTIGEAKDLAKLFGKMAAVMGEVGRVAKNGQNTEQRYAYTTEADLLDEVRPLMAKHGIAFFPSVVSSRQFRDEKDRRKVTTTVVLQTAFCCTDTGAMLISTWHGEAVDWGDKSYWKAYTGTLKYAHFKTWMVSTGDDPEADTGEDAGAGREQEQARGQAKESRRERPRAESRTNEGGEQERTQFHTTLLEVINRDRKLLPDGFACTVGKTQTPDLKRFIAENWELLKGNVTLARKVGAAIDAALKEINKQKRAEAKKGKGGTLSPDEAKKKLHARYFALMTEKHPRLAESERDRHAYQKGVVGKESTNDWGIGDYEKAILGIEDGSAEKYELPM